MNRFKLEIKQMRTRTKRLRCIASVAICITLAVIATTHAVHAIELEVRGTAVVLYEPVKQMNTLSTALSGYCLSSCSHMFLGGMQRQYWGDQPLKKLLSDYMATMPAMAVCSVAT